MELNEDTLSEIRKASSLILCGLDYSPQAARDLQYAELIRHYETDPSFDLLCNGVADGLNLRLLHVSKDYGVIMSLRDASRTPFVLDLKNIMASLAEPEARQLFAVVLVAVVTFLFENQSSMDPERRLRIAVQDLEMKLRTLVENLSNMTEGEIEDPADTAAEMFKLVRKADVGPSTTDGGLEGKNRRFKKGTLRHTIHRVFDFLEGRGFVTKESDLAGGTYRVRPRFVIHTTNFGGETVFELIRELTARKGARIAAVKGSKHA